jgi:hypothetical protein
MRDEQGQLKFHYVVVEVSWQSDVASAAGQQQQQQQQQGSALCAWRHSCITETTAHLLLVL